MKPTLTIAALLLASAFFVSPLVWIALAAGITLAATALIWIKGECDG